MPIVNGEYECEISTTFRTPEEGVEELKKKIKRSRRIRINNLPVWLLKDLMPLLADKDLMTILPKGVQTEAWMEPLGKTARTKAKIYLEFKGVEAYSGSVYFSDIVFTIVWADLQILEVAAMEYTKCVKCFNDTFNIAWHYSEKLV